MTLASCECGCGREVNEGRRFVHGHTLLVWLADNPGGNIKNRIDANRMEKKCSDCKVVKPRDEMVKNKGTKDGMSNMCRPCMNERASRRDRLTQNCKRHGITPEVYQAMWEAHGGLCALCGRQPIKHIDHDHRTGKVRGLLCMMCNTGLGKLGDDEAGLERALAYVRGALHPNEV